MIKEATYFICYKGVVALAPGTRNVGAYPKPIAILSKTDRGSKSSQGKDIFIIDFPDITWEVICLITLLNVYFCISIIS